MTIVKKKNSQNKTVIFNIISTIILQGLAFFTSPYFSRVLGTANFGIVSVYATWVQVASIIFGLRINGTLIMGQNDFKESEQTIFQSSALMLTILSNIVFSIITILVNCLLLKENNIFVLMIIIHGFGFSIVTFVNSKYTNEFRADLNCILSIFMSVSTILLSVILISFYNNDDNYWGRIFGEAIPYFLVALFLIFIILKKSNFKINYKYWGYCIPLAIPMVFHGLAGIILNQSDRVMLKSMTTDSIVGIYSLAYTFSNVLFVLWSALNNSWVPFFYDYMRKNELETLKKKTFNYMELFTAVCSGFILLSPEVYHIFSSKEYWSGTNMLPIFSLGTFFVFLYSFPVNYEIFYKKTKAIAIGSAIGAGCNILMNIVLIKLYSEYGAAYATLLSYVLQFMFHHINAKKIAKTEKNYHFHLKWICPYIIILIILCVVSMINVNYLIRWIFAFMIGIFELIKIRKRKGVF